VTLPCFDFRILGPLEVSRDGKPLAIRGSRQRTALALLLLNANRTVPRDQFAEALEYEQADADHAIRIQISRLRRVLAGDSGGSSPIHTRPGGYLLRLADSELDLDRFTALVTDGRRAADQGELERAAATFERATSLWRGAPLDDVAGLAADKISLEERGLTALEELFDVELRLRTTPGLVERLERLVREHPWREGFRAQLMLALYRCGRQADALEVYRSGSALLDEQLGLRPGERLRELEAAILRQDADLQLPDFAVQPAPGDSPPQRGARARSRVAIAVAALAVAAALVFALVSQRTGTRPAPIPGNSVALLSGARATASVRVAATPTEMAIGAGSLWVTHLDGGTVSRIDLATRALRQTIEVGHGPLGIAVTRGDIWVANSLDGTVSRLNPQTNTVVQTIAVGTEPSAVVAASGSIWVTDQGDDNVLQIEPLTGRVRRIIATGSQPADAAVVGHTMWVANRGDGTVTRIDTAKGAVVDSIRVGDAPSAIAATPTAVWVADPLDATVSRIDAARDVVTAAVQAGGSPTDVTVARDGVVVSDAASGRIYHVNSDGRSLRLVAQIGAHGGPLGAYGGQLWVGVGGGGADHHGGVLHVASLASLASLDPALEDELSPLQLLGETNDGLVTLDHTGGPDGTRLVPDLALSLPRPSDGGRTYVFRLRRGIRFSNGLTVNAVDVRQSFERLFELDSPGRSLYEKIRGAAHCINARPCSLRNGIVASPDGGVVTFRLTTPDPDFLFKLAEPYAYVLPSNAPLHIRRSWLPATGPYRFASFTPGQQLRLVRNPRFREWSAAAQPAGYPDQIIWTLGQPPEAAVADVEQGKADLVQGQPTLPPSSLFTLRTRFPSLLHRNPAIGVEFYFLNTRVPPFDQLSVRRAFNLAIDRDRFVELAGGPSIARPTCQTLPPGMPGYRSYCPYTRRPSATGRWHGANLEAARRLVAASGTRGTSVTVWDTAGPLAGDAAGEVLVQTLRRLGFRASLHLLPDAKFLTYTDDSRNRAQVVGGGWSADYPSPSAFIGKLSCAGFIPASSRSFDNSEFCDPSIDREIARAEAVDAIDHSAATLLWQRLDRQLTDRAIWLPTVTIQQADVVSSRVQNYQYNPFWGAIVDQLWVR
jgi:YVTN family beta-propeller protein